jgi:hypothetical protein
MGQPIAVRTDFSAVEVRRLARRAKDSDQVRRLMAIAAVLDGASRAEAAKVGGMDRQTLRDWVIRFNEQGPDGLINVPAPGAPAKLNKGHRAFLALDAHGNGPRCAQISGPTVGARQRSLPSISWWQTRAG